MSEDGWVAFFSHAGKYDPLKAGSIDGTDTVAHDKAIVRAMCSKCKCPTGSISYYNARRQSVIISYSAL